MLELIKLWDWKMVLLSYVIGFLGSYTTTTLLMMLNRSPSKASRSRWLLTSCVMYGGSIWALHFTAMLGMGLPISVGYDVFTTAASFLVAVGGAAGAFYIRFRNIFRGVLYDQERGSEAQLTALTQTPELIDGCVEQVPLLTFPRATVTEPVDDPGMRSPGPQNCLMRSCTDVGLLAGAFILSLTVAAMHFCGLSAILAPGLHLHFSAGAIVFALFCGWAFLCCALVTMPNGTDLTRQLLFSSLSALAVFALHYISMLGTTFTLDREELPPGAKPEVNWGIVFAVSVFVAVMCFTAVAAVAENVGKQRDDLAEVLRARSYISALEAERETLVKQNKEKTDFLAIVSHELRTPLHGMSGAIQLLDLSPLNTEQVDLCHLAGRALADMEGVIDNVLGLVQVTQQQRNSGVQWLRPRESCRDIMEALWGTVKDDVLAVIFCADEPFELKCDPFLFRQVVRNLVGNAYKFTDRGFVLTRLRQETSTCVVEVHDSGIGISQEFLQHLFEPFRQKDTSLARLHGGTGIGLSLCRKAAEHMGGRIEVESVEGEGSTFTFTFPCDMRTTDTRQNPKLDDIMDCDMTVETGFSRLDRVFREEWNRWRGSPYGRVSRRVHLTPSGRKLVATMVPLTSGQPPSPSTQTLVEFTGVIDVIFAVQEMQRVISSRAPDHRQEQRGDDTRSEPAQYVPTVGRPSRALVAEDNPISQKLIAKLLHRLGWDCDLVENGEQAVRKLETDWATYGVVLMDCQMPEMDGYEATRRARASGVTVPIYALTANVTDVSKTQAEEAGMNGFLSKPLKIDVLRTALEDVVANGRLSGNR